MKPLSLVAVVLAAFFILVGFSTRATSGVLSNAVIIAGGLILSFVIIVWTIMFIKEKKDKKTE